MLAAAVTVLFLLHPACAYRAGGALPDPGCTPGAANPAVTQQNIGRTICRPGWTATVRPSSSWVRPRKAASLAAYDSHQPSEYDHLISLELGGAPTSLKNLWPEAYPGAYLKDTVENRLHREVCAGLLPLRRAQQLIRTDWRQFAGELGGRTVGSAAAGPGAGPGPGRAAGPGPGRAR